MFVGGIFILLIFLYGLIILNYRRGWKLSCNNDPLIDKNPTSLFSIIIPARNEEHNIKICLDSIQNINYPKNLYEVIVVDDFSEDSTSSVVKQYPNIKLLQLKNESSLKNYAFKKQAIALGVSKSKGEYIVTTDADCIVPADWLHCFDDIIRNEKSAFIAAPVTISQEKGALQIFEALDFMMLQGITAAAVHTGIHTMSNGANLCYRKSAYEMVGGFDGADHIASGDDMLLMQKIKNHFPNEIKYCGRKEAIVFTKGANNLSSFIHQRIRWASKGKYYQENSLKLILITVYLFNLSILALMISCFFIPSLASFTLIILASKIIIELIFMYKVSKFYHKEKLLLYFIPFQPLHIAYMVLAGGFGNFRKYKWKGRSVR